MRSEQERIRLHRYNITLANQDFQYLLFVIASIGRFKNFIILNTIKSNLLFIYFI